MAEPGSTSAWDLCDRCRVVVHQPSPDDRPDDDLPSQVRSWDHRFADLLPEQSDDALAPLHGDYASLAAANQE